MPDYKKMYLRLAHETEKAIRILTDAQQECEELYLSAPDDAVLSLQTSFKKLYQ